MAYHSEVNTGFYYARRRTELAHFERPKQKLYVRAKRLMGRVHSPIDNKEVHGVRTRELRHEIVITTCHSLSTVALYHADPSPYAYEECAV